MQLLILMDFDRTIYKIKIPKNFYILHPTLTIFLDVQEYNTLDDILHSHFFLEHVFFYTGHSFLLSFHFINLLLDERYNHDNDNYYKYLNGLNMIISSKHS